MKYKGFKIVETEQTLQGKFIVYRANVDGALIFAQNLGYCKDVIDRYNSIPSRWDLGLFLNTKAEYDLEIQQLKKRRI